MPEEAREEITVRAPQETCYAIASDYERYPEWAEDLKEVEVVERDGDDRPLVVAYRAAAFGRSTSYRLRYDYSGAPDRLGWTLEDGDIQRRIDGAYNFEEGPSAGSTTVTYELTVDLKVPLPSFLKRRGEERIIRTALAELKERAEAMAP